MAISFGFFSDQGLTIPATSIQASQATDGNSAAVDRVVYYGSNASLKTLVTAASPYSGHITFTPVDANAGSGVQASHIKLATTQAGLAAAIAGVAIDLGPTLQSGKENAVPIWMRIDTPALAAGVYTDITLTSNSLREENA